MLDVMDFLEAVTNIFHEAKDERDIDARTAKMVWLINRESKLAREYLRLGCL